jgi:electron transport complex protein RnfB
MSILIAILLLALLAAAAAGGPAMATSSQSRDKAILTQQVDAVLPQTQCTRCGFSGCLPYAKAIVEGLADINRCPPGGEATIAELALLLGKPVKPLALDCLPMAPGVAGIIEELCIGCARCIKVCPVDAIIGAPRQMHTVIKSACTGCELCLPVCPTDCIVMYTAPLLTTLQPGQSASTISAGLSP